MNKKTTEKMDTCPLVEAARAYIGVPFKHRGRSVKGMDCAGLVLSAAQDVGHEILDKKVYGREPHKDGLREMVQKNAGLPLNPLEDWRPGDILLMRFSTEPHHLAILGNYLYGGFSIIHSYGEASMVVEHRMDDIWLSRIIEVYRLPSLSE